MSRIGPVGVRRSDVAWVEVRTIEPLFRTVALPSILPVFSQVTGTVVDLVVSSVFAPFCTIPVLT